MSVYTWTLPGATGSTSTTTPEQEGPLGTFYGTDIWLDLAGRSGPDYVVTAGGDWKLAKGIAALRQSLLRRFMTDPGEWKTKGDDYGAGGRSFVKSRDTLAARQAFANRIRAQALKDTRVAQVNKIEIERFDGGARFKVVVVPKGDLSRSGPITVSAGL